MHPVDDTYYEQLFTPRKPKSKWAASNKARVEKMIAAGLMTEAGMKPIELAKTNGTWNAQSHVEALTMPPDFKRALAATPGARKEYDAYTPGVKKQCLYYINDAKRPETRAKRIARSSKRPRPDASLRVRDWQRARRWLPPSGENPIFRLSRKSTQPATSCLAERWRGCARRPR